MKRILSGNLILVAAAVFGSLLAGTAAAQTRPALVRDADQPARQSVTIRKFTATPIFEAVYTVPAGKHFVLEHMNCASLGDQLYAGIFNGPLAHSNIVYSVPVISTSATVLVASGDTRIYFATGAVLNLRIFTSGQTTCTLSGYTVDVV